MINLLIIIILIKVSKRFISIQNVILANDRVAFHRRFAAHKTVFEIMFAIVSKWVKITYICLI